LPRQNFMRETPQQFGDTPLTFPVAQRLSDFLA
jgi:hypothetical protein